jgi:hypothetical protein
MNCVLLIKHIYFIWNFCVNIHLIWILKLCIPIQRPPLWSSRQSFWLQILRSRVRFLVGLKRGTLSLVSTIEEQLGRNSNGFGLEYGRGDLLRWSRDTPLSAKVGTNFAESEDCSVVIVRSQTKAKEFVLFISLFKWVTRRRNCNIKRYILQTWSCVSTLDTKLQLSLCLIN